MSKQIATSCVEDGLDFACSLAAPAITAEGEANPEKCFQLLGELTNYIELRYVGEFQLALEVLAGIGHLCSDSKLRSEQFWSQLRWVASEMRLTTEELERLELPC